MPFRQFSHQSIKDTCQQYEQFLDESTQIQSSLSSFLSSLKTSLILLPNSLEFKRSLENKEIQKVKAKVQEHISGIKDRLEN